MWRGPMSKANQLVVRRLSEKRRRRGAGPRGAGRRMRKPLRREPQHGVLVLALAHLGTGKDLVLRDPLEGFLVGLLGIRLEHQPLARAPAAGVHLGVP